MKVVVDTCVIIDALQDREPFYKTARELILHVSDKKFTGVLTAKSVTDIYYILRKSLHDNIVARTYIRCIVTRNQKDYTKSKIPVYSPEEFLAAL